MLATALQDLAPASPCTVRAAALAAVSSGEEDHSLPSWWRQRQEVGADEDTKEEQFGSSLSFWTPGSAFGMAPCVDVPSVTGQLYPGYPGETPFLLETCRGLLLVLVGGTFLLSVRICLPLML